jgi:broad specificity phosphatase PhoE
LPKNNHHTRLFLIRHGDTVDEDAKKVYKGSIDIPLSNKGIARMERVASFLSGYTIDVLYSSTLSRAIESARIIGNPHKLDVNKESGFNELGFGKWEGLSFNEINEEYPELFPLWSKNPVSYTPPDGEHLLDARERMMSALYRIIARQKGRNVAIVSHSGTLKIIISTLFALDLSHMYKFAQDYGCVDIIDIDDNNKVVIKLLNYTIENQT